MTRANHSYDKGHFEILNNASVEITILLLDAYCSSITSYCFTKLLPACIALTRVVTLRYQGSIRAVPTLTDQSRFYHGTAWYKLVVA